ncbi:hypothetical protein [Lysobacter enzymogenes]|uniref:hypothetical protein n=1 Tax=Lysobacter enzymogenes TaxID=69 RepID=UPI00099B4577|nr:hypothetical protein [Lysobacter enzymogenes]QQP99913.1 hypothetical protein JHW41_17610 [Lysobacter enzymogenes]UZW59359.1 hypothetical protein BV903_018935 [Lysobacter enzymogenes]
MAVDRRAGYGLSAPDDLIDPEPSRGRLFGALAWCALLLGPAAAWLVVFGLTPDGECGDWSLHCAGKAIMYSAASWLFGSLLAIAALFRGERRGLAVPALVLNLIPLLGLLAAYLFLAERA